ncbi:bromodomain-containing protein 4-like [Larimichthys crocea]|uniref:bromodomain-containing protein 4-like n=1 Tax=Larimichthys crocea TaxID=215358 RepID=UPI000F5DEEB0|nr:bromodomain-containing protein 4-like [Larimichthys crocea]
MAAGFLITRILLVFWLSEPHFSSAFPRDRSFVNPVAWHSIKKKQEGYGYGNRRPLQYIQALRQTHIKLQPNIHDQDPMTAWQKPQSSVHSHAQIQNQPSLYHQTQNPYEPRSDVSTKWTQETSQSQHPPQRNLPLAKPRSFEFNLKIPFVDSQGQSKETSSTTKGLDLNSGGYNGQSYRPSSVQIYTTFNSDSGSDGVSGEGSTKYPNGGKSAHEISKPSFQLNLSVPIPPRPSSSNDGYVANLQKPGRVVQNSSMESSKPQSIPIQSGSEGMHLNSDGIVQQQTEHQPYKPVQTLYTNNTLVTFSPGHASQPTIPSQNIPTQQTLVFPQPLAPSLLIPQYPPLQRDNVHSGYYSSQINPLSNSYGNSQSGQTISPEVTNPPVSASQYETVPSGHYSAGQVKPSDNSYVQHQSWQPVGGPTLSALEQYNYGLFKPSSGQNVEAVPHQSPVHPSFPTAAQPQYELPSYHKPATNNYYGTHNVVPMGPKGVSSSYQHSRDQSGQAVLPALDSSQNFQGWSTHYQPQIKLPAQNAGGGQLDGKPQYRPLEPDNVHSGYYSSQINPWSNGYGSGQSGQMVSPEPTNPPVTPSQYETAPSGHYSAGQVKPSDINYGQHQSWQLVGAPPTSALEQYNYGPFKPSTGQNVVAVPHQSPVHPLVSTVAQPQYELPSYHQPATNNYYGVQLSGKPRYTKLFIDVEDETDKGNGQYDYSTAPQTYYDGHSRTWPVNVPE